MDLKGLDLDQPIGGFDKLVLVEKKNWKDIVDKSGKDGLTFLSNIPDSEDVEIPAAVSGGAGQPENQNRLLYVIVQCVPIPLMKKITKSSSIIVPVLLKKQQNLKQIYRSVNGYMKEAIEDRGLHQMKNSTKLILSE